MIQEIEAVATFVAKVLIYSGGAFFLICFLFGAFTIWQIVKIAFYFQKTYWKWKLYNKLPVEAKGEADKSGNFEQDIK